MTTGYKLHVAATIFAVALGACVAFFGGAPAAVAVVIAAVNCYALARSR